MNIFKREMKANLKSLIVWSISMAALIALGIGKFSSTESATAEMVALIDAFPKSLKAIFGFGNFDISKAIGFYGILYLYLVVMGAIHASMLGAGIISKEERDKTTEFLLVKPIKRSKVLTDKLLASIVNVLILNVITFSVSFKMLSMFPADDNLFSQIAVLMFGLLMIQLIFLTIGMAFAAINKNSKKAPTLSTSVILAAFFINILVQLSDNLAFMKFFTPFQYFNAEVLLNGGHIEAVYVILSFVIMAIMLILTYNRYEKRDLMV